MTDKDNEINENEENKENIINNNPYEDNNNDNESSKDTSSNDYENVSTKRTWYEDDYQMNNENNYNTDNNYNYNQNGYNNSDNDYNYNQNGYDNSDNNDSRNSYSENDFNYNNNYNNNNRYDNENTNYEQGSYYQRQSNEYDNTESKIRNMIKEEVKNAKPKVVWLRTLALVLVGAIVGSLISGTILRKKFANNGSSQGTNGLASNITIDTTSEVNVENAVAKKASPSVVGVLTTISTTTGSEGFLFNFPQQEQLQDAIGSGVIVSSDGYILTNSHVVNDGDYTGDIKVVLSDGTDTTAELLWYDSSLDLAIIKVEKTGLQAIEVGDSETVEVGDKAIAIGNPLTLSLQSTLTSGYISGLNRSITMEDGTIMDGLIQTDAAINGGNSGGALLNSEGKLIGINTAKASQADGIGFAIPINVAMPIVEKVTKTGSFTSVYLGIQGIALETYKSYYPTQDYATENGILVASVESDSCANDAGLTQGDIIVSLDDKETGNMSQLKKVLLEYENGDEVKIQYYHDGSLKEGTGTFKALGSDRT